MANWQNKETDSIISYMEKVVSFLKKNKNIHNDENYQTLEDLSVEFGENVSVEDVEQLGFSMQETLDIIRKNADSVDEEESDDDTETEEDIDL